MNNTDTTFNEAKQLYLETYGDAIVTNTYLKIAVAALTNVCNTNNGVRLSLQSATARITNP